MRPFHLALPIGLSPLVAQTELVDVSPAGRRCRRSTDSLCVAAAVTILDIVRH